MEPALTQLSYKFPKDVSFEELFHAKPMTPFSDDAIAFFDDLSKEIMNNAESKKYPDVITFAFWIRKNSLLTIKKGYDFNCIHFGRGVVFHISPSNVPVNFAYSFAAGLLAGNSNIVRLPSREFRQIDLILDAMQRVLDSGEHRTINNAMAFVKYDHNGSINSYLSERCDVRVIWGGDNTVAEIRKAKLPSKSFDITFADRYSVCLIDAEEYLQEKNPGKVAQGFYNDTYLFDQNACTAPHLIYWIGQTKQVEQAKEKFWDSLHQVSKGQYVLGAAASIQKLSAALVYAASFDNVVINHSSDNHIFRIELPDLPRDLDQYRGAYGCFFEYESSDIGQLYEIISRKYQTLSYYGFDKKELESFLLTGRPAGIDRIVPIGETLAFSLVWDGFDLIESLSRKVVIQ